MSARDDYPLGRTPAAYTVDPGVWHALCDEIDRLRDAPDPCLCGECGGHLRFRCTDCGTWHGPDPNAPLDDDCSTCDGEGCIDVTTPEDNARSRARHEQGWRDGLWRERGSE